MHLQTAERKQVRMKMALQGTSGSGKTMSALLLAYGITGNWNKIAVVDTENGSASLYSSLGSYQVIQLTPPFSPERYIKAVELCEDAGIEVVIIDSLSHCWEYLLDIHANMAGNSFTNWSKITPRQSAFINKILQSNCHVIATMRTKQEYVLSEKNGKQVPEKVGLKAIQRDGVDFEFTLVFDLDLNHHATASKDRTSLFMGKPQFRISEETGREILDWCQAGISPEAVRKMIAKASTLEQLVSLYHRYHEMFNLLEPDFSKRKMELNQPVLVTAKHKKNGLANSSK